MTQYGKAWNMGASITQEFTFDYRSGLLAIDFSTPTTDRTIVVSPQQLWIYNPEGKSYANISGGISI
jgi:hypothetical protein